MTPSLARHDPIAVQFFTIATAFLSSLSLLYWRMIVLFRLFVWLFVNLMMREQTLVSCVSSRFSFVGLTFGRMPILTRRSRASTFQEVFAWLSKNSVSLTSASDASFLDALRPRVIDGSEGVAAFGVGFCAGSLLQCRQLHW